MQHFTLAKNRRKLFVIIFLAFALLCCASGFADELNDKANEILDAVDTSQLDKLSSQTGMGNFADKVRQLFSGEFSSQQDFLSFILTTFLDVFSTKLPALASVFAVCALNGLSASNKSGFISESTNRVIYFVCYASVIFTVLCAVADIYEDFYSLFDTIKTIVDLSMPVVLTLVCAAGGVNATGVFRPSVALLSNTVIRTVTDLVMPMFALSLVFAVVSNLSNNVRFAKMSKLFSDSAAGLVGIVFMVFSSFLTIQGVSANAFDSISAKLAKFAAKNYIPILGGYLSDGMDLVLTGAVMVKNSFGVAVLLLALLLVAVPLINALVYSLGLQLISAFAEPLCDEKFIAFFSGVSKNITMLIVAACAVYFMFFILVLLTLCSASVF